MKNKGKFLLIFFITFIIIPIQAPVRGELNVGDYFIYEITSAGFYVEIGENQTVYDGYKFNSKVFPVGIKVNATVVEYSTGVQFQFWIRNYSRYGYLTSNWFDILGASYGYLALFRTYEMVRDYINYHFAYEVLYQIRPYIHPPNNNYLENISSLGEDITKAFSKWYYKYPNIEYSYESSEKDGLILFESWVGGKVNSPFGKIITDGSDYNSSITFGNNYHLAVEKTTGVVHGFGRRGWVKGKINDTIVKVSMDCQYELEGYDMSDYVFGNYTNFVPGFGIILPFIVLVVSFCRKQYLRRK